MYHLLKSLYLRATSQEGQLASPVFTVTMFKSVRSPAIDVDYAAGKTTLLNQIKTLYPPNSSPSSSTFSKHNNNNNNNILKRAPLSSKTDDGDGNESGDGPTASLLPGLSVMPTPAPTVGQNVVTLTLPDMYLRIWDIGGQASLRTLWQSYYASAHAIVFVLDATDAALAARLDEARTVLADVLAHADAEGVPLLVLANKRDRDDWVEVVRVKEGLLRRVVEDGGDSATAAGARIRDSRVLAVSALDGTGVVDALSWLRTRVKWNTENRPPVMR
ncbi:MAG: hypothetical protein M1825_000401 [Sarcosagium campestre]|nr:MAG: hypothetical protein M1825_000401 [Sarcosagium campestre]